MQIHCESIVKGKLIFFKQEKAHENGELYLKRKIPYKAQKTEKKRSGNQKQ